MWREVEKNSFVRGETVSEEKFTNNKLKNKRSSKANTRRWKYINWRFDALKGRNLSDDTYASWLLEIHS